MLPFTHVSTKLHYGLVFLSFLARAEENAFVSTNSVAEQTGISQGYLEEILALLKGAGIVEGVRGSGGGYRLAKMPQDISMQDVFEALEGRLELVPCIERGCSVQKNFEHSCASRRLFAKVQRGFQETLHDTRLSEMLS